MEEWTVCFSSSSDSREVHVVLAQGSGWFHAVEEALMFAFSYDWACDEVRITAKKRSEKNERVTH